MKYSIKQYASALYDSIHETNPKNHDKIIENFISVLKNNNDLHQYEEIVHEFENIDKHLKGEKNVNITTAKETKVDAQLVTALNKIAGKKAHIIQTTDESIIGGMIIKVEDTLIDGSTKTQLSKLKKSLKTEVEKNALNSKDQSNVE